MPAISDRGGGGGGAHFFHPWPPPHPPPMRELERSSSSASVPGRLSKLFPADSLWRELEDWYAVGKWLASRSQLPCFPFLHPEEHQMLR